MLDDLSVWEAMRGDCSGTWRVDPPEMARAPEDTELTRRLLRSRNRITRIGY